jgi:hypothetical protein
MFDNHCIWVRENIRGTVYNCIIPVFVHAPRTMYPTKRIYQLTKSAKLFPKYIIEDVSKRDL